MAAMIVTAFGTLLLAVSVFCYEPDFHDHKYTRHPNWRLLPIEKCGKRANFTDDLSIRTIGGRVAELGQFPWMAEIVVKDYKGCDKHHCGGSIINDRYILTAAHCVYEPWFKVRLGEHTLSTCVDCTPDMRRCAPPAIDVDVEEVVVHPWFSSFNEHLKYDLALIRLKQPIYQFNDYIRPICLPTYAQDETSFENVLVESAGWGWTLPNLVGGSSDQLQTVRVPLLSEKTCNQLCAFYRLVKDLRWNWCDGYVDDNEICAGKLKGKGVCHGDSGGPLMTSANVPGRGPSTFLVGVVSRGIVGCEGGVPDVYMRVAKFVSWILDNIHD
uniref:Peptidase S1 domain-containing protein n=1 Tax=Graphocephala atropunctata TaxID=36148 RepID=A0A1B6M856_9HEMI